MPRVLAKTIKASEFLSRKFVITLIIFFILFLLGLYFYQVQDFMKSGYLLTKGQKQLASVQSQSLNFNQQSVELASLGKVEQGMLVLNFVKNDTIKYIPLSNDYLVISESQKIK